MNILKLGFVLMTAVGFGFGVDKINDNNDIGVNENDETDYYNSINTSYCHSNEEYFGEHMFEYFNEENQAIVHVKIDELLLKYDISIEELEENYDTRHLFMAELMEFLEDNDLDYHYHNHYEYNDENNYRHGGMGMHN